MNVKIFSGNRIIDTVKGSVIEKKISILVENEIIVAIDSPDKISSHPLFENSEKIELSGTILPGLVDCHVHLIGFGDGTPGDGQNNATIIKTLRVYVFATKEGEGERERIY